MAEPPADGVPPPVPLTPPPVEPVVTQAPATQLVESGQA